MIQTLLRLRPYQSEAIEKVFGAWREGMQRPAIVLPTGTGKTVVFSHVARHFIDAQTGPLDALRVSPSGAARVVILVHRDELADQALAKLRAVAPELSTGKVKAGDNEITADVMVCSVQTIAREQRMHALLDAQAYAGDIGLVIVDECHHAVATSYRNIMAALGCYDPDSGTVAVGFTATLARGDGRGLGGVWDDVVYTRSVLRMIADGFLVDVRARQVEIEDLDLRSVRRSGGDYSAKSLGEAMQAAGAPELIKQVIQKHAADRRSILVFCPTVEMAEETAAHLRNADLPAAVVHGGTPREDRLRLYERFRRGTLRVIVNCMVLTEGADFPYADCAVIARPTRSETLFIQMVGRVLRPSPVTGKKDALVLLLSGEGGTIRTLVDLEPGVIVPVLDGESLAEAYERQEEIREQQEADRADRERSRPLRFQLKHRDLDLFTSSPAYQWLRTRGGVQFIPLGGAGEVALWPSEQAGLWDVILAPDGRKVPWQRLHTGLELSMAMAWGESEAEERSLVNTGRGAAWRKKPASEAQLRYLEQLRCELPQGARAGEAGDAISVALASRKLDRYARSA
jgi:superfamily II DNA or RNA helicase